VLAMLLIVTTAACTGDASSGARKNASSPDAARSFSPDGGSAGHGPVDAGVTTGGAFQGQMNFTLKGGSVLPPSLSDSFTFYLANDVLTLGSESGSLAQAQLVRRPDGWSIDKPFVMAPYCGSLPRWTFQTFVIRTTPTGAIAGDASGLVEGVWDGDIGDQGTFAATFTAAPDQTPPVRLQAGPTCLSGLALADPFESYGIAFDEPLPPGTTGTLTADTGETVPLVAADPSLPVTFLQTRGVLAFSRKFRIAITTFVDLAGNRGDDAVLGPFSTPAADFLPPDGFEAPPYKLLQTRAAVVEKGRYTPLEGMHSLFLAQGGSIVLRLKVAPGQHSVRLLMAALLYEPTPGRFAWISLAAPFGVAEQHSLPDGIGPFTQLPDDGSGAPGSLGATMQAEVALPAGVTDEVMVELSSSTGGLFDAIAAK
jgi:hypothetical protein